MSDNPKMTVTIELELIPGVGIMCEMPAISDAPINPIAAGMTIIETLADWMIKNFGSCTCDNCVARTADLHKIMNILSRHMDYGDHMGPRSGDAKAADQPREIVFKYKAEPKASLIAVSNRVSTKELREIAAYCCLMIVEKNKGCDCEGCSNSSAVVKEAAALLVGPKVVDDSFVMPLHKGGMN